MNKFDETSELNFLTYIEDIKNKLKKEAPQWEVKKQRSPTNSRLFYHLSRFDFTIKDQAWPFTLHEFVFAYEEDGKYYLFNQHPIVKKG